jgi:hypothetical protein
MNAPKKRLSGLAGYLQDIYLLSTCKMVNPHSFLKFVTIKHVCRLTQSLTFIETGTYLGGTAYRCAKIFKSVYTIELDPLLVQKAASNLAGCSNVKVIHGEAVAQLGLLFDTGSIDRAVVFLDGHFSGGDTAHGEIAEPALQELQILSANRNRVNAIIIDDFRNFGVEPGHPKKSELFRSIETGFPQTEFTLQVQNDQVILTRKTKRGGCI